MSVKNIMLEIEELIKNTVMSCASLYGFSAEEALAKIDSNGNLIRAVKGTVDKEALVKQKATDKAEKQRIKVQKEAEKEAEKASVKQQKEAEKASVKQQKEAEKASVKQQKEAEKLRVNESKKVKNVVVTETYDMSPIKEDDDCFILFQNIPLLNEINSIRDVKKIKNYKKLSAGVKLARQVLDI